MGFLGQVMPRSRTRLSRVSGSMLAAASVLAKLVRTTIEGPGKYHPEQHYMRGPGPKWREKHMFDVTTRGV
jgi:hypothetical protein